MTCHKAFFGKDVPCAYCPLSGATEVYNPQYDVWTKVRYSDLMWNERKARLITCFDITQYKTNA